MKIPVGACPGRDFFIDNASTRCDNKEKELFFHPAVFSTAAKGGVVMKRLVVLALIPAVLTACTPVGLPIPQTAETAQTAEVAASATAEESPATITPSPTPSTWPEILQPVDLAVLPYDEIRQVYAYSVFDLPASGYYTMSRDGLWGLMRNDGSQILPCMFDNPIAQCSDATADVPAWIAAKESADPAFWESTGQYLSSVGEGRICDTAHCGPGYEYYFWDESQKQMFAYIGSLGPSVPSHITPAMQAECGWWFPTRAGTLVETDWGLDVDFDANAPYRYRAADGTPLNNYEYQQAGLFYDGSLLAAARRGSKWVYLDGTGREVTTPDYDPVYRNIWNDIGYASPLLNGYAAVGYQREKLSFNLGGEMKYRHATGNRVGFNTVDAFEFRYGGRLNYTLPWDIGFFTQLNMYSRRGYDEAAMNTDYLIWNASLSRSFLKGRLSVKLEGTDLLRQMRSVFMDVNVQGKTETYYNIVKGYYMLTLGWKLRPRSSEEK